MICQLRIHAWLTTAGAIRKEGRPTGIFQRELYYGHAINNGAPRPSDFNFRATISHLNGIPITELPRLSFQRLSWYASAQNQALFVDVSLRDENEYYSWDRVLEGNFTEFFRADELLVAVRLADRNNTTRPTAVPSLNPQFRLGDPHSGSGTCPALTPALAPAVTPVLTPAVTPVLTPVQDQIVAPQEHTIAPSGLDRCSEHK
ncbi:hypothetical protein GNI_186930 [Gregarina niphandrodes]|uniref:Uncharacterized protein n=1 Tax=Gregarina niphandrodes TaxID=110365 RepID=A0A023AXE5_GRENI|nr:hypothetical protein GNI_186930 [Gregarina niphandrodes]EZG43118.1 hypothetical protein GNI_186930 [Gregarina niphandrodes]|eukprot:XP_011133630.1 hypothetical protein GNI_186930 [Gregarina niphandrodes]